MNDHVTDTSPEAIEAATATAPSKPAKARKTRPEPQPEAPAVRILKVSTCPSLSGRSELTYHMGCIGEAIQLRVYQNSGKGYFNQEWISFINIMEVLDSQDQITAASLRSVFVGKSVNTAGFFLAVLKDLGLIVRTGHKHGRKPSSGRPEVGCLSLVKPRCDQTDRASIRIRTDIELQIVALPISRNPPH